MKRLPLYIEPPQALAAKTDPVELSSECTRCDLRDGVRSVCIRPEGDPRGLLVIGDGAGKIEDQLNRPFVGVSGKYLRGMLKRHWSGPIAYDNVLRCAPGARTIKDKHYDACMGHTSQVLRDVAPSRIILLGSRAISGVFGMGPPVMSVRRGYGFVFNDLDDAIPVFFLIHPVHAMRNRFLTRAFELDLKWALTCPEPQANFDQATYLVENATHAKQAAAAIAMCTEGTYDVETHGRIGNKDFRLEAVTILGDDQPESYTWTREALKDPQAVSTLVSLLEKRTLGKVTQNGKYDDLSMLAATGAQVGPIKYDTRLGRKILEPESLARLEVLAFLVGMGGHKEEAHEQTAVVCKEMRRLAHPLSALTPKGKARKIKPPAFKVPQSTLDQIAGGTDAEAFAYGYINSELLYRYNARDVFSTRAVQRREEPQVRASSAFLWDEITSKANEAVRYMENWGMGCDRQAVTQFAQYCRGHLQQTRTKLDAYGKDFNPDSPKQVGELLFGRLKLKHFKKTKSGAASTDAQVLEDLEGQHSVVADILRWRKYGKLNSTYAEGMLQHIRDDGRVHPSILIDGTGTGRASCQDPNLQNIPRAKGDPDAKMARSCFVAPEGYSLLEFDYGQIELRVAAYLSGDPAMIADFQSGIDIHMNNATELCEAAFGIARADWDNMTKDQRDPYRTQIKTTTFGKLYQKSLSAMAKEFNISVERMARIDAKIWGKYRRLLAWCKEQIVQARKSGEVWTYWRGQKALRRPLWAIGDADEKIRTHAENASVNTPVQGTAAHFTMASLLPIVELIRDDALPAKLVATVHDSVILEVKNSALAETAAGVKAIMCGHDLGDVPLVVDAKKGPNWGSMSEYHVP